MPRSDGESRLPVVIPIVAIGIVLGIIGLGLITLGGLMSATNPAPSPPGLTARRPPARLIGSVFPNVTAADVCDPGYAQKVRNVPESLRNRVFREAGIPEKDHSLYEIDHIVPLSVGGDNSKTNLQAQTWDDPDGAHTKDRVEFMAFIKVRNGELTITQAQAIFRTPGGWQEAYKKYGLGKVKAGEREIEPDHDTEGFPR